MSDARKIIELEKEIRALNESVRFLKMDLTDCENQQDLLLELLEGTGKSTDIREACKQLLHGCSDDHAREVAQGLHRGP